MNDRTIREQLMNTIEAEVQRELTTGDDDRRAQHRYIFQAFRALLLMDTTTRNEALDKLRDIADGTRQ